MFYSRPKIEPLGWDLVGLPTRSPDSDKHFDGLTSDGVSIDFRFSGGWLTVERGPANASPDGTGMEELLSVPISPFGTMDMYPEQLCDILGLTVNGRKIDSAWIVPTARGFDWSGRTTYWQSTHLMDSGDDARIFIQGLCDAFPGSILIQPEWGSHGKCRCRRIKFLMATDDVVTLGIGGDEARIEKLLAGERVPAEEYESTFHYRIEFSRTNSSGWEDVTGDRYIRAQGATELDLHYSAVHHRRYRIRTQYLTDDADAQSITGKLLSIVDRYFSRGLRAVNLETGEVLEEHMEDETDENSYSQTLKDRCLENPKRYLFVGMKIADQGGGSAGKRVFFGARPAGR